MFFPQWLPTVSEFPTTRFSWGLTEGRVFLMVFNRCVMMCVCVFCFLIDRYIYIYLCIRQKTNRWRVPGSTPISFHLSRTLHKIDSLGLDPLSLILYESYEPHLSERRRITIFVDHILQTASAVPVAWHSSSPTPDVSMFNIRNTEGESRKADSTSEFGDKHGPNNYN